jgi:hypothetical protein
MSRSRVIYINDTKATAARQQLFLQKTFRDTGYLIALIAPDVQRARQNVRFRSFRHRPALLYQRLKNRIFAPESN